MDKMQIEKESKEEGKQDYLREKEIFWEIYRENRKEKEDARLKSRSLWLKAGDKNTSFFHNTMKIRRARNQIEKMQVESQEVKGAEELKKAAHQHFKNLLSANEEMAESEDFLKHTFFFKRSKCRNVQGSHRRRGSGGHMEPASGQSPGARWFHNSILQISLVYHQKGFLKNG